jgi:hypothetical protein
METINNTQESFFYLWRLMRRTRQFCRTHHKRFCIRHVLELWFEGEATAEFIWQVCHLCEQAGWDELPAPSLFPRQHRELLRAIVAVRTGTSYYRINLHALDAAYAQAFPNSTPINVNKKRRKRSE